MLKQNREVLKKLLKEKNKNSFPFNEIKLKRMFSDCGNTNVQVFRWDRREQFTGKTELVSWCDKCKTQVILK